MWSFWCFLLLDVVFVKCLMKRGFWGEKDGRRFSCCFKGIVIVIDEEEKEE